MVVAKQLKTQTRSASQDSHQGNVDSVGRGSTHHSGHDHAEASEIGSAGSSPAVTWEKRSIIFLRFCTTLALGSAAKPRNADDLFLKLSTRFAACATRA